MVVCVVGRVCRMVVALVGVVVSFLGVVVVASPLLVVGVGALVVLAVVGAIVVVVGLFVSSFVVDLPVANVKATMHANSKRLMRFILDVSKKSRLSQINLDLRE